MYFDGGQGGHITLATPTPRRLVPGGRRQPRRLRHLAAGPESWQCAGQRAGVVHDRRRRRSSIRQISWGPTRAPACLPIRSCPTPSSACGSSRTSRSLPNAPCTSTTVAPASMPPLSPRRRRSGSSRGLHHGLFPEQLAVLNPQAQAANVQVDFRPASGESPPPQRFSSARPAVSRWTSTHTCRTRTLPSASSRTGRSSSSARRTSRARRPGRHHLHGPDALTSCPKDHARPLLPLVASDAIRPYVALNMVATVDGRTAVGGSAKGIGTELDSG